VKRLDVCVVGEINLDVIFWGLPQTLQPDRERLATSLDITLGGSSALFAHNLSSLGARVGMVSLVGPDGLGGAALEFLTKAGVDTSHVIRREEGTPTGLTVILARRDHRQILTYPGTMAEMRLADLNLDYIFSARHLHVASFFLQRAMQPDFPELFRRAKEAGLSTSLDTNDDPTAAWGEDFRQTLPWVDILFPNEREACRMAQQDDVRAAARKLAEVVPVVAIKRGAKPAVVLERDREIIGTPPVVKAVDTVGAGDSFDAGFIHERLAGKSLERCLEFANIAGAFSTTRAGGAEAFRDRDAREKFFQEHLREESRR